MKRDYETASRKIAAPLLRHERDLDLSIASGARLLAAMAETRAETHAHIDICHRAMVANHKALSAQMEARSHVVAAHLALAQQRTKLGLEHVDYGDEAPCVPIEPPKGKAKLQAVA